MTGKNYSVIVPVYNSSRTLRPLLEGIISSFGKIKETFEVIFIEDCSGDDSWNVLCKLKKEFPETVTVIRLAKNFGQHNAILCGLNHMSGKHVITIDDDLQIPPEEIEKLIAEFNKTHSDVIYGIYSEKKHGYFRNFGSRIVQKIFKKIFKAKNDITSFRLISEHTASKLKNHKENFVFVDGLLHWYTNDFTFVRVRHEPRKTGKSGYNIKSLIKLANNLLFNFTTLPLKWMTYLGLTFSLLSFISAIIFIFRKLIYAVPLGYTSIIVTIFFFFGITLLVIGVIGEYVSRLYSVQNEKPQYSVKEII